MGTAAEGETVELRVHGVSGGTAEKILDHPIVYLVAGDRHTIAGIAGNQRPIYDSKPPAKQLRTIRGGYHCGFMDSSSLFCDSGTISRATQLQLSRRLLTQWFLRHLNGDATYDEAVWGVPAQTDPAVAFEGVR